MTATRIVLRKASDGSETEVTDQLLVGRLPESGLVLTEGHPSRRHAMITAKGAAVTIEDLQSANGTFVNDVRLTAPALLNSGDRLRFDTDEYVLRIYVPEVPGGDGEKTLLRRPEDLAVDAPGNTRSGPAWINPDKHAPGGPKTEFIDAAKLKEKMLAPAASATDAAPAKVDAPTLSVSSGSKKGTRIALRSPAQHGEWTLGSDTDRDIVFNDEGVSGVHAKIAFDGKRWRLSDQMSANGTYVNGKRSNMSYLGDGDRLRFGPVECLFQVPSRKMRASGKNTRSKRSLVSSNVVLAVAAFVVTLAALYIYMFVWR
jgi:pSer/pThr/pTyr-binding forkhead associated (FHA) protein